MISPFLDGVVYLFSVVEWKSDVSSWASSPLSQTRSLTSPNPRNRKSLTNQSQKRTTLPPVHDAAP